MRSITVSLDSSKSLSFWWDKLSNIKQYEKYVPFIKDISLHGESKAGTYWYDTTTIAFFPLRVRHNIVEWKEKEKIVFEVPQPGGGIMREIFNLEPSDKGTKVVAKMDIDYPKSIISRLIERFLIWRFNYMLSTTIKNLQEEENSQ